MNETQFNTEVEFHIRTWLWNNDVSMNQLGPMTGHSESYVSSMLTKRNSGHASLCLACCDIIPALQDYEVQAEEIRDARRYRRGCFGHSRHRVAADFPDIHWDSPHPQLARGWL